MDFDKNLGECELQLTTPLLKSASASNHTVDYEYLYESGCRTESKQGDVEQNHEPSDRLTESKGIELKSFALNINYNIMNSIVVMYS